MGFYAQNQMSAGSILVVSGACCGEGVVDYCTATFVPTEFRGISVNGTFYPATPIAWSNLEEIRAFIIGAAKLEGYENADGGIFIQSQGGSIKVCINESQVAWQYLDNGGTSEPFNDYVVSPGASVGIGFAVLGLSNIG